MTPDLLRELSLLPLFPQTARELVRIIGVAPAAQLIAAWGGRTFPVPMRTRKNEQGERRFEQLAQIVGGISAMQIVRHWGGRRLDIPNCKEVLTVQQHRKIRGDYDIMVKNGYSHPEAVWTIGINIGQTDRAVEKVLERPGAYESRPAWQGLLF